MKIKDLTAHLESIAPPVYQESYDNAGLITGDASAELKGVMLCLDSTEAVVDEAIEKKCNLIVAHHPIVFKGLKSLTGRNYVERVVIKAIRHEVAIYAIHTNLDNVYHQGVNARIAERIGLQGTRILAPRQGLRKLSAFVSSARSEGLRQALLSAGAGTVSLQEPLNYYAPGKEKAGKGIKLEAVFSTGQEPVVMQALREHSNGQQLPYDIVNIENTNALVGSGMVGSLPKPMEEQAFLQHVKKVMKAACIRHTHLLGQPVKTVALCGGAGGFLLGKAKSAGAQVFITADYKYHEFFDAEGQIVIADIGHYESEQFTIDLLYDIISQKFSNFALYCTKASTNPVHYLC